MTQNFLYIFPIVNVYNEHIKIKGQLRLREKKTCYTFFIKIQKSFFYFISIKLMIIWKELDKHHWHWKEGWSEVARVFFRSWGWVAKKMKPHFKKSLSEFFFKPAKFKKKIGAFEGGGLEAGDRVEVAAPVHLALVACSLLKTHLEHKSGYRIDESF